MLLCACYDGYGVSNPVDKSKYIKNIVAGETHFSRGEHEFRERLQSGLKQWRELVATSHAAAIVIHYVDEHKATAYWRRHGIVTASAKLNGGWAVAGANFAGSLPSPGMHILASQAVTREHLRKGNKRSIQDAKPLCDYVVGDDEVRVRLFEFGDAQNR